MFYRITFRTYCYATEALEKVEKALQFVTRSNNITKTKLSGYYGNPVIVLETELNTANDCNNFFSALEKSVVKKLITELEARTDEDCNFYIRFDKQKAFEQEYQLTEGGDTIATRCKLKVFPPKKEIAILKLKEFLENLYH
ncbi:MAG: RNA-binding domain-containing protein [Candidatus Thermoplasmatota archaeon]|nr:RNA-binding domain-containing protein [Candidatus Thermoplasmatota archaeon]MDI6888040.1 RNA-binding domain-containing protein [Candidatus Thermoplasmatota archaeon]